MRKGRKKLKRGRVWPTFKKQENNIFPCLPGLSGHRQEKLNSFNGLKCALMVLADIRRILMEAGKIYKPIQSQWSCDIDRRKCLVDSHLSIYLL